MRLTSGREASHIMLGEHLRHCREVRGFRQTDVAHAIRASVSKISRLERGESPPKVRDVIDIARFLRLDGTDMAAVERLLDIAQKGSVHQQFSDVTPHYLKRLISLEASAVEIMSYELQVIPGLLQVPSYAKAIVSLVLTGAFEINRASKARVSRSKIFDNRNLVATFIMDEGVLLRPRGGPAVMREQLLHLLAMSRRNNINIRIVPFDRTELAPPYAITQMRFADGPSDLVYAEHINGAEYITNPDLVDVYRRSLHNIVKAAADRKQSEDMIAEVLASRYS
ncbi:helix-turn-helix transcriptional regulator [Streptomyces sp. GZWMJZ-114]|uniref:helix-turn-helix domain-containing protein n=1 Tax=Streptomyces sp. GZWMJZ-114 TaxID=2494734 RepID=UPI0013E9250C|nr:helix-turn-helix transcriptional regulator [Streptomyces sp. GZWMJZ-114]